MPDTLEEIGDYAFSECGIKELELPDSLQMIGEKAFEDTDGLNNVDLTLPKDIKTVGDEKAGRLQEAFQGKRAEENSQDYKVKKEKASLYIWI